jgi:hypothetical protein
MPRYNYALLLPEKYLRNRVTWIPQHYGNHTIPWLSSLICGLAVSFPIRNATGKVEHFLEPYMKQGARHAELPMGRWVF